MKNPTISDVAARAGVSKSTVSAVLNNKPSIKESTRRAVLLAMSDLNYRPSPSARRGFRPIDGRSIGFVVKEAANPYYTEILEGIQSVANEAGYLTFSVSSEGDFAMERRIVEQCMDRELDGLIVTPIRDDDADLSHVFEATRSSFPLVLLEEVRGLRASLVDVDNAKASCRAVRFLIEHGHSRIVHFAGPPYSEHSRERANGVWRAFSESHLAFDGSMVVTAGHSLEDGYRTAMQYFGERRDDLPTAVTCYNDLVALGVLKALRELGIDVPGQVSVVGFDNLRMLDYFPLRLSTVDVPRYEMGRRAAEVLIRQIESKGVSPLEKIYLDAQLLVRDSTRSLG